MSTQIIEGKIAKALAHEKATGAARQAVRNYYAAVGRPLTHPHEDLTMTFITDYIRHVPALLAEGEREARRLGVGEFNGLLEVAEWYWALEEDVLPDRLGLFGVADDAYCTLCLLQQVSDRSRAATGSALMGVDLSTMNATMRALIGEPFVSQLDSFVTEKMNVIAASSFLGAIFNMLGSFGPIMARERDPIWGNASNEEIVNLQMGALGFV